MASSGFGCHDGFMLAGRMTDRRGDPRRGHGKLVQVLHEGNAAYARCRDFSDTGMRLDLITPLPLDADVTIALSSSIVLCGKIAWVHASQCGIVFDGPVDSEGLLAMAMETASAARPSGTLDQLNRRQAAHYVPPPRRESEARPVSRFKPGLSVKVVVAPDEECRGVARWLRDDDVALELLPAKQSRQLSQALVAG